MTARGSIAKAASQSNPAPNSFASEDSPQSSVFTLRDLGEFSGRNSNQII